ncbi:MAG TPA: Spy/CpxP family protein refolding chaperone [Gemmatimonadales bacterium]|nr:Spy/CpxP family protein refolding chaperone [Gemmatimonadales bacterium]
MKRIQLIGIGLSLIALPLAAQDTVRPRPPGPGPRAGMGMHGPHGDHMMRMMGDMMGPMMRVMAYEPAHLLAWKDSLQLTNAQVTKLTAIRDAAKSAHDAAAGGAKTHMNAVAQAFQAAAPDTNAMRAHFNEAHAAMGKAHGVMLSAAAQAKAVLTDAQRQRVDAWANAMQQQRTM